MDRSVPPGEIQGELTPPCSKSYAQRALAAALLAEGESTLRNIELCDDTRSAMRCIEALGADVTVVDPHTLKIRGGLAPRGRRYAFADAQELQSAQTLQTVGAPARELVH